MLLRLLNAGARKKTLEPEKHIRTELCFVVKTAESISP